MDIEKQMLNIERGKQIGYRIITEKNMKRCGIQKRGDKEYLVFIAFHDFEYDQMDTGKKEFYSFSTLKKAIEYIISRDFPFDKFAPPKGNKIFYADWFKKDNTVIIE